MIKMIMITNLALSLMFICLKHPLSMGGSLLIQTILISLVLGNSAPNFWFSYILFLIMVGGMLVLFIYMTSVASNEPFKTSWPLLITIPTIILSATVLTSPLSSILIFNNKESTPFDFALSFNQLIVKFMNWPSMITLSFMIVYLLITLVAVVKITDLSYGPLRANN
uniref:NADH-ubiquinone oxidoreductase chain 6 n=1 Tax=Mordella atrata TaxID=633874 RepID=C8YXF3_9CUCU|nr:NADH dehydrogenase subunit 6 [Mordella atrata]ACO92587.1 NADH dehydrogenase subunit 6 [Mordella atrata]